MMEESSEIRFAPGLVIAELKGNGREYMEMYSRYSSAMLEVETKFKVLNIEFSSKFDRNPIETIKTRLKRPASIIEKMKRIGVPLSVANIERELSDVAGVRVICSFVDDIYKLADMLAVQDDVYVLRTKDYIKHPKEGGYRSLHMIVEVPIFLSQEKRFVRVEVQLRTIAMDFWASLEHKLRYKKDIPPDTAQEIAAALRECADTASRTDIAMNDIRKRIEASGFKPGIEN